MNRLQRNLWLLATVIFAVCITVVALWYIVTEPWHVLTELGGDGAKNFFTYLYHSMYGKGYWFTGMNYPFGEHIVFTDGIPLLSVFFASIGNVEVGTALSALWWLIGLGYVLSVVYVYKTLLRLGVAPLFAMIFAGFICILTPQWIRIRGHYALSLTCFIPMLLYWTLCWYQDRKLKYWAYVFVLGILCSFLHPYYAGIALVWVVAFCAAFLAFERGTFGGRAKKIVAPMVAAVAIPLVVMIIVKLTDPATDRLPTPYTSAEGYTNIRQVITSYFSPFWEYAVKKSLVKVASNGGEGFSYIGLVPIAVMLLSVPVYFLKKRQKISGVKISPLTGIALLMASGILLFSMGYPLRWNMPALSKLLFVFKQFRTIGRFAWMFYYIVAVFSAVTVYCWFKELVAAGRKRIAVGLLTLAMLVWACEAVGYMQATRQVADMARYNYEVMFSVYEKKWPDFLREHQHTADDFQSILLLKFYHVGTDKIWVGDPSWTMMPGSKAALQLHLPIIDVMMARSSLRLGLLMVKLAAGPYADKPMLRSLKSDKPFLLLDYDTDSLSPDQAYLLKASDYIGDFPPCRIYACYPSRIAANDKQRADSLVGIVSAMSGGADTCLNCIGAPYIDHCEQAGSNPVLFRKGATAAIRGDDSVMAFIPVRVARDSELYEYSCWFLVGEEDYRSPELLLEMQDSTGHVLRTEKVNTAQSMDSHGLWLRCSKYFYIPGSARKIKCTLNNTPNPTYIAMDEVMLRQADAMVISKARDGSVMVNNHLFKTVK